MGPLKVLSQIWRDADCPAEALGCLRLTGAEPVLPSSVHVEAAAQATIAAATLAAAELWRLGTGSRQRRCWFQPMRPPIRKTVLFATQVVWVATECQMK